MLYDETAGIDPLHGDVTFGYFHIHVRPFDHRHGGGQKCITVIERKALIVSLLTNASDYSSKTTIICKIQTLRPFHTSLIGVVTCISEQ